MNNLACLALIISMEAGNQPIQTQDLVAEFALNKAESLHKTICESLKVKGLYSWVGGKRKPDELAESSAKLIASHAMRRKEIKNYTFFNKCDGKKFHTGKKLKSFDICFY